MRDVVVATACGAGVGKAMLYTLATRPSRASRIVCMVENDRLWDLVSEMRSSLSCDNESAGF